MQRDSFGKGCVKGGFSASQIKSIDFWLDEAQSKGLRLVGASALGIHMVQKSSGRGVTPNSMAGAK